MILVKCLLDVLKREVWINKNCCNASLINLCVSFYQKWISHNVKKLIINSILLCDGAFLPVFFKTKKSHGNDKSELGPRSSIAMWKQTSRWSGEGEQLFSGTVQNGNICGPLSKAFNPPASRLRCGWLPFAASLVLAYILFVSACHEKKDRVGKKRSSPWGSINYDDDDDENEHYNNYYHKATKGTPLVIYWSLTTFLACFNLNEQNIYSALG